jgi:4'-phosphopantetheinyl transferase
MTAVSPNWLPDCEVHVWLFPLAVDAATAAALGAFLSPDEHERAARFRHADDVRRYRVARGALRALLARYLDAAPGALRFAYGAHGKPGLAPDCRKADLEFNLSHSGDVALAAFVVGRRIGVDLEHAERVVDALALAGRYGSAQEQAMLAALDPAARSRRFIELWTCKEAWLKAAGLGITAGLAAVDIESGTGQPRIVHLPEGGGHAEDWSLARFEPAIGLVAAVALHDPSRGLGDIRERETRAIVPGLAGEWMTVALRPRRSGTAAPPWSSALRPRSRH